MDTSDDYTRSSFGRFGADSSSLPGPSSATGNTTLFSGLGKNTFALSSGDASLGDALALDDGLDEGESLLQKLTRYWVDERNSPEILEWQGLVVDEVLNRLHAQAEMVEQLQSDPRTSEEEYFRIILIQTEAERVKFLVRSYLRARLHKIEKCTAHILASPEQRTRLSVTELAHAEGYKALLESHFHASVLNGVPESLRSLNDEGESTMVSRPNMKQGVFVRARRRCTIVLPDGETLDKERGGIHLVQYGSIERLLRLGDVELV